MRYWRLGLKSSWLLVRRKFKKLVAHTCAQAHQSFWKNTSKQSLTNSFWIYQQTQHLLVELSWFLVPSWRWLPMWRFGLPLSLMYTDCCSQKFFSVILCLLSLLTSISVKCKAQPRSKKHNRFWTGKEMLSSLGYPCRPQSANALGTDPCPWPVSGFCFNICRHSFWRWPALFLPAAVPEV